MQTTARHIIASLGLVSLIAFGLMVVATPVAWADPPTNNPASTGTSGTTKDAAPGVPLPLGDLTPETMIGRIINYALGLTGVLALVMFIYGGITWMTAGGNSQRVDSAKRTIIWATVGLLAVFAAYGLVALIIKTLT